MRRADSAEYCALVGREARMLPLARCPPDRGFAYDCVLSLFSLVDLELPAFFRFHEKKFRFHTGIAYCPCFNSKRRERVWLGQIHYRQI
jgi:hypothetical protein